MKLSSTSLMKLCVVLGAILPVSLCARNTATGVTVRRPFTWLWLVLAWSWLPVGLVGAQTAAPGNQSPAAVQNLPPGAAAPRQWPFCFSDELLEQALQQEPALKQHIHMHDEQIKAYTEHIRRGATSTPLAGTRSLASSSSGTTFIIPVVVYVVHQNGPENITDQQVMSQLDALNNAFDPQGIKFCLATTEGCDNFGCNPFPGTTPGIFRIQNSLTDHHIAPEEALLKGLSTLPPDRYLRIWVVRTSTMAAA